MTPDPHHDLAAPVYRNVDTASTIFGLEFYTELPVVVIVLFVTMRLATFSVGAVLTLAVYVGLRVLSHGKPSGHLRNLIQWHVARAGFGGVYSASNRARSGDFRWAGYRERDR